MGFFKNVLLVSAVVIVLGIMFVFGLFTGWKLTSRQGAEETIPSTYQRQTPSAKPAIPSTPIIIIPHRPTTAPSVPSKPKITKPQPQPEISITPSNITPPAPTTSVSSGSAETHPPEARPQPTPSGEQKPGEQKLFKVTIGPMGEEEAKKLQENFAKEGKQAFLVPSNGKYKLQMGAFIQKENAQQLVDELKKAGYNPIIEEK